MESNEANNDKKWEFADYAFLITGIIVVVLLVVPEILAAQFGISFAGGSLRDVMPTIADGLDNGDSRITWDFNQLRALSPMLFLLTITIVFFKDTIDARKSGGYKGSMFTHTFESLLEESIYMAITTIMVYSAILVGAMYISWLAGPITWVLFILIFPLARKKSSKNKADIPWVLLTIFALGIIIEVISRAWIAFPLSWLIICIVKLIDTIREGDHSVDTAFNIMYYAFAAVLMAVGIIFDFWIWSWASFPIALLICWILSKFGRFKKA
ncbi:MAG: hypothetical protein FWE11_08705 [Defluviitaleaceae bacterium]|nr:hypothetical protein [Defluviitaleaceae bacterium]